MAVVIEPEFVNDKTGAAVLAISPRSFAEIVRRGDLRAVKVPGIRRTVYSLPEIRALAGKWREENPGKA